MKIKYYSSILFLISLGLISVSAATPVSDFTYKVQGGNVTILSYKGSEPNVEIPAVIEDAPVIIIGSNAFRDIDTLETVIIPDTVTEIEISAFRQCANLKNVSMGKNVSIIGSYVFEQCPSLETITLGKNVSWIGNYAFTQCSSLKTITFPSTLTHLGEWTLKDCTALTQVYFMGNTPGVPVDLTSFPFEKNYVFTEPYPTLYYLEGTAGWAGEYYTDQNGDFVKGDPFPSGRLIIYPGVEVGVLPPIQKNRFNVNWWTKGIALETWTLPADKPELFLSKRVITENEIQMTLVFGGALQSSTNLKDWEPVETASPYLVSVPTGGKKFYRAISSEIVK
jgi:hypothetical protein